MLWRQSFLLLILARKPISNSQIVMSPADVILFNMPLQETEVFPVFSAVVTETFTCIEKEKAIVDPGVIV